MRGKFEVFGFVAGADDFNHGFWHKRNGFVFLVRLAAKDGDIGAFDGTIRKLG